MSDPIPPQIPAIDSNQTVPSDGAKESEPGVDLETRICELERQNAELRELNSEFEARISELTSAMDCVLDSLPLNVLHKDLEGRIIYANPSFSDIAGLPVEELLGKTDFDLSPPDLARKYQAEDQQALEKGEVFETVEKFKIQGIQRYVFTLKSPLRNPQGEIRGIQVLFWDITDLKDTEKELQRSNMELNQFAYVASHDLQEPLRAIRNFCELLQRRCADQIDEKGQDFMRRIVDGATRMQRLIDDLLAYSRLQTQNDPYELVEMQKVCVEAVAMLQMSISECGGSVQTLGELPILNGDRGQLLQLMENLIGNALKYRREGESPDVTIGSEFKSDTWEFSVMDNGIGIPPDKREVVFDVFRRLHGRDEYSGTGIGLAKCERVVRRHGGKIWVEGHPDGSSGSVFKFTIPADAKPSLMTQKVKLPSLPGVG